MIGSAVAIGRIAMTRFESIGDPRFGASDRGIEIIYFKPKQQPIARRFGRIADRPVMVILLPMMQLQDQLFAGHEAFIVRPAMRTLDA